MERELKKKMRNDDDCSKMISFVAKSIWKKWIMTRISDFWNQNFLVETDAYFKPE